MLLVKASKGPSRIHGLGLIARQFIPKGMVIWRFMPGFDIRIPWNETKRLSETAFLQVLYYSYFDEEKKEFILSADDDRFTNHSDSPNSKVVGDDVFATCDICPDEEITADYRELNVLAPLPKRPRIGMENVA